MYNQVARIICCPASGALLLCACSSDNDSAAEDSAGPDLVASFYPLEYAAFEAGLASCTNRDIVTSHTAFGYLAQLYGLEQVGIAGLPPEDEPSPQDLPAVAETVAEGTGARTAVLDPIEGISDESAGRDYFQIMRADLASLQDGQSCS